MMCGVMNISNSSFWFELLVNLKRLPSSGMSPRSGTLLSLEDFSIGDEAADDDGLAVGRHDHGVGGTFEEIGRIHGGRKDAAAFNHLAGRRGVNRM